MRSARRADETPFDHATRGPVFYTHRGALLGAACSTLDEALASLAAMERGAVTEALSGAVWHEGREGERERSRRRWQAGLDRTG